MAQTGKEGIKGRKRKATPEPKKVAFDYIKSNYFRVISVNGIWGGLSPNGDFHMAVYSQRRTYPQQVTHEVSSEGVIGEEVDRRKRDADIIREIEAALVFNVDLARSMVKWLEEHLAQLAEITDGAREEATPSEGTES